MCIQLQHRICKLLSLVLGLEKNGRDANQRERMDSATNPQPMPRTKSAFDVGHDEPSDPSDFPPLIRNQSDTSLDARDADLFRQRPPHVPEPLGPPQGRPVPVPAARTVPVRTPSVQSAANEGEDQDSWVSLPPPKSLPPLLPQEIGRGPPPPVPSSRPVGAPGPCFPSQLENAPMPAPRRDIRQDFDAVDPPVKPTRPISSFAGAVPTPFAAEMFAKPGQNSSPTADLIMPSQISVANHNDPQKGESAPLFVDDPIPNIPPRPRVVPARPLVGAPAIPARSSVPPVQGPPPQIPPRQGTSS